MVTSAWGARTPRPSPTGSAQCRSWFYRCASVSLISVFAPRALRAAQRKVAMLLLFGGRGGALCLDWLLLAVGGWNGGGAGAGSMVVDGNQRFFCSCR